MFIYLKTTFTDECHRNSRWNFFLPLDVDFLIQSKVKTNFSHKYRILIQYKEIASSDFFPVASISNFKFVYNKRKQK